MVAATAADQLSLSWGILGNSYDVPAAGGAACINFSFANEAEFVAAFSSWDVLWHHITSIMRQQGYMVVKRRATAYKQGKPGRYDLACDRSGKPVSMAKVRSSSSRKTDCSCVPPYTYLPILLLLYSREEQDKAPQEVSNKHADMFMPYIGGALTPSALRSPTADGASSCSTASTITRPATLACPGIRGWPRK